jgi:hypothetical protein
MNSSGIVKKGLAASAISALAITGVPALVTSASAAPGDVIQIQSVGPARNAGTEGAIIVLNTSGVPNEDLLEIADLDGTGDGNDNTQAVAIIASDRVASGAAGDSTPNDGLDQITLRVTVTTPPGGDDVANFLIFEDEAGGTDNVADVTEARVPVAVETTGAPTTLEITPPSQTSPAGTPSAPYTVTIRDAEGDLTQLTGAEVITLDNGPGDATFGGEAGDGDAIDATEIRDGNATFTATGTALTTQTITASIGQVQDTATLTTTQAAVITLNDLDIVTGADTSEDDGSAENPTAVRVDQPSVRFDISSDDPNDANGTVTFTITGTGVTFGGQPTTTLTTTLDGNGVGSIVVTPDAGTIQDTDSFEVDGSGIVDLVINYDRSVVNAASVDAPPTVFTQVDTPTTVTVLVTDQFGLPVPGAQVSAAINGNGVGADPASDRPRQTADASGQVTFTFPAGDTQVGDVDTITYSVFDDAADASATVATETTTVNYTADGRGPDYQLTLDGTNTELATYSPDDVSVVPLTDALANDVDNQNGGGADETVALTIANGAAGVPVTVTVDNGALIFTGADRGLEDGESSATGVTGDTFQIAGTTAGVVTVTTVSAGRTETAQFTVEAPQEFAARNVAVSGPATVPFDTEQIVYTAVVTDAFGNPVAGVFANDLNVQVTGPGELQDSDAVSNAMGMINFNVDVDEGAEGPITIRVQGIASFFYQFGADADRVDTDDTDDADGEGLPASNDVAEATTVVQGGTIIIREPITATLDGRNIGPNSDKLIVRTTPEGVADLARVNLFRINKNGTRVLVESSELNANGIKRFQVVDTNGKKNTRYVARVKRTDDSTGVRATNVKRIK